MSLSASMFINMTLCVEVQSGYAGGEERKPTSTHMKVIIVTAESAMAFPYSLALSLCSVKKGRIQFGDCRKCNRVLPPPIIDLIRAPKIVR